MNGILGFHTQLCIGLVFFYLLAARHLHCFDSDGLDGMLALYVVARTLVSKASVRAYKAGRIGSDNFLVAD